MYSAIHQTVTIKSIVPGACLLQGPPTAQDSWFPGYAWTIAYCSGCYAHLGWRFTTINQTEEATSGTDLGDIHVDVDSSDGGSIPNDQSNGEEDEEDVVDSDTDMDVHVDMGLSGEENDEEEDEDGSSGRRQGRGGGRCSSQESSGSDNFESVEGDELTSALVDEGEADISSLATDPSHNMEANSLTSLPFPTEESRSEEPVITRFW